MRTAAVIYHKNVHNYPPYWIEMCVESIQKQTYSQFDVFEVDYGGGGTQIYPNSIFSSEELPTHAHAHNYLLDKAFFWGYDYVFNCNVDDYYHHERFEKQLVYAEKKYDVISSNFYNVDENNKIKDVMTMHDKNIIQEANKDSNIIAHPVVCYSKHFWTTCSRLNPEEIPRDDFELWKRSYEKYKFIILPEFLLYYRVHSKKVCGLKSNEEKIHSSAGNPNTITEEQKLIHDAAREEWLKKN